MDGDMIMVSDTTHPVYTIQGRFSEKSGEDWEWIGTRIYHLFGWLLLYMNDKLRIIEVFTLPQSGPLRSGGADREKSDGYRLYHFHPK